MRSYFTSLAKQSGVEIGASNLFARRGALPRVPHGGAGAPLYVDTVDIVDPMSAGDAVGLRDASPGSRTSRQELSEGSQQQMRGHSQTSNENDQPPVTVVSSSDNQRALLPGTNSVGDPSMRSFTLERASNGELDVPGVSARALEEHTPGEGGIIRVGEHRSFIDQKPAQVAAVANRIARHEPPIPSDYLEGIREWLASTPGGSENTQTGSSADLESFATPTDRSSFFDSDSAPQNNIQEFSLSIGSISIIVEEPQQPKQLSNNVQPAERAPADAQPRARDAFALSRSYFRGF